MSTNAISGTTGASNAAGTQSATAAANEASDRFLKLLVTQMQNQDPLNPMDNAQVTTQLAQINTVRGIETLNGSVGKLVDRGATSSPLDAVGMLGRQALVDGMVFHQQHQQGTSPLAFFRHAGVAAA